jgi:hypothetical protein
MFIPDPEAILLARKFPLLTSTDQHVTHLRVVLQVNEGGGIPSNPCFALEPILDLEEIKPTFF